MSLKKYFFSLALLFLVCYYTYAQKNVFDKQIKQYNFTQMAYLDSVSLVYFLAHNIQGLENLCQQAQKQNVEVFYLYFRTAILHFQNKNYSNAIPYFQMAYQSNPGEPFLKDYLYYSLLLSGRLQNAREFAFNQDKNFLQKINLKKTLFSKIGYTFINTLSNQIDDNINTKHIITTPFNNRDDEAWGTIFGPSISHIITLQQYLFKNRLMMNYMAGIFNVSSMAIDQLATTTFPQSYISRTQQMNNTSYQLAASGLLFLGNDWIVGAGYSSCLINYSYILSATDNKINYDYSIGSAIGVSLGKRFKNVQAQINYGFLNLFDYQTHTIEPSFLYFPFGNFNFYGQTKLAFTSTSDSLENTNIIISQMFGKKIINWLWLNASFAYGRHTNYVTDLSMSTFNTAQPILMQGGVSLKFIIKKLEFNVGYNYQQREQKMAHIKLPNYNTIFQKTNHSLHQLSTSILWNF